MKLRTGRKLYKIPEHSQILSVSIEARRNQPWQCELIICPVDELGENKFRGFPTTVGIFDNKIEFMPIPDKPYNVRVRYLPPVAEY